MRCCRYQKNKKKARPFKGLADRTRGTTKPCTIKKQKGETKTENLKTSLQLLIGPFGTMAEEKPQTTKN